MFPDVIAAEVRQIDWCDEMRYRTDENGLILVTRDDGIEKTPTVGPDVAAKLERIVEQWDALARRVGARWGVPPEYLIAMIKQESDGYARAFRQERDDQGLPIIRNGRPLTGIGLMQITDPGLKGSYTDEQLYDAELNIELGARHIARTLIPRYGRDFPKVSAAYNAGSVRPSSKNEWGYVCTGSHIDAEVCALNWYILRGLDEVARAAHEAVALQFDLSDLVPADRDTVRET